MKNNFVLLFVLIYNLTAIFANGLESNKKYRIESNYDLNSQQRNGALALGAYHNGSSTSFYVKDGEYTEDCWWTFEIQSDGTYLIKNSLSGEYMCAAKKWEDIKMVSTPTENAYWNLLEDCGHITLYVKGDETLLLHFGDSNKEVESASTSRKEGPAPFFLFNIYDEDGKCVDAMNFNGHKYCGTNANIPERLSLLSEYANNIKINGKLIFSTADPKGVIPSYWLASKPNSGKISIEGDFQDADVTLSIMNGSDKVEKTEDIETGKEYTLAVSINGTVSATSKIRFTTMPIIDIRHEGKLTPGMLDYLWGETTITSMEEPGTVVLSSRYKTRGATASKYSKHSLNIKLRNRDTDKEEDTTLLGLRSSSSWILDAMAIDRINMRNRVCFDLWNEFSKLPYDTKFGSRCGTVGKFVEVIENGKYMGIYCLTDRINRKLLDLKKPATDSLTGEQSARGVLYKSTSWDYTGLNTHEINDYKEKYGDSRNSAFWCSWELAEPEDIPGEATWEPLESLYLNEGNIKYYKDNFYINNVCDYHLFILATQATDNGNKNEFIAAQNIKKKGENKARMFFCPWDLDATLSGNYDGSQIGGEFVREIKNARINKNHPFASLLKDEEYLNEMRTRWKDARTNVLSRKNLEEKMKNYSSEFINSGAWARESEAYGNDYGKNGCAIVDDLNEEIEAICNWYDQQILRVDDFLGVYHVGYKNIPSSKENADHIYDLFGRKLNEIPNNGIFIRDGKVNMIVK
ncbi:MAG: hypothetical protein E7077_00215 [Bacteroidales bacterium]|jgi:hypothetical protein|nr:hypothetical protein [Bacteroidales bacterium]